MTKTPAKVSDLDYFLETTLLKLVSSPKNSIEQTRGFQEQGFNGVLRRVNGFIPDKKLMISLRLFHE